MSLIWAGITLGFISSFHCLGMCGPIALALPIGKVHFIRKILAVLLYNTGRIFTYTILGALFGILGSTLFIGSFQNAISLSIGIVLLLTVFYTDNPLQKKFQHQSFWFFNRLKNKLAELFSRHNLRSVFFIGLLNGLLPCGMVYMAIAASAVSGSISKGMLFMSSFGFGTLTVMLTLPLFGNFINQNFRNKIQKITPVFKITMATLLILRGLNLGIPYISPEINQNEIVCHNETKKNHPPIFCGKVKTVIKK